MPIHLPGEGPPLLDLLRKYSSRRCGVVLCASAIVVCPNLIRYGVDHAIPVDRLHSHRVRDAIECGDANGE